MATSTTITGMTDVVTLSPSDYFVTVDVSDTTQAPTGTTKKVLVSEAFTSPNFTTSATITGASSKAFAVGRLGATTPAFAVDSSTASQVAGILVVGAATGGTVAVSVTDSGSNAGLSVNAKGTGAIVLGNVSTGGVTVQQGGVTVLAGGFVVSASGAAITGNSSVTGTLGVSSDFAVATTKFTVTASSGNIAAAGTITDRKSVV